MSLKLFLTGIVVASVTLLAYLPALNNQFQTWDTWAYIINNPNIKALSWENIHWMFTSFYMSNWHPLTWLSHALDYAWFADDPWGHHLVSIIIHSFNAALLFILAIVVTSLSSGNESRWVIKRLSNKTIVAAGIASLVFGIHPQHVESVVWVAERKDVLSLFFILLTLLCYVFFSIAQVTRTRFSWYLAALLFFTLALLSKPMAVTIPVVLLLLDIYPLNRAGIMAPTQGHPVSYPKLVAEKIPFFVLTLLSVIVTIAAQHQGGAMSSLDQIGLLDRTLNAFNSIVFYVSKLIFPIGLSPFYPYPSYEGLYDYVAGLIPVIAFFLITFVCGYMWYKKHHYWMIAWLFYLVTLSPVLGIIQVGVQASADRYAYLPTIPFYVLIGVGLASLIYAENIHRSIKFISVVIFLLVSTGLFLATQKQTRVWENDETFWSHIVAHAPESPFAQFHLAEVYLEKGDYGKAAMHYRYAMLAESDNRWAINLPIAYIELGQLKEARVILDRLMADSAYEDHRDYFFHMSGWIYLKQGRLEEAEKTLKQSLQLNPDNKKVQGLLLQISARRQKN